jgi:Topoisomerase DNA binding C4 zinc finger
MSTMGFDYLRGPDKFGLPSWPPPSPKKVKRMNVVGTAVEALRQGATLREAAKAAGVHVASLCRWQNEDQEIQRLLRDGKESALWARQIQREQVRSQLPKHGLCPVCNAPSVVRTAKFGRRFWGCSKWPDCNWASWKPRYPIDCSTCGSPRYWSHGYRMIRCPKCGLIPSEAKAILAAISLTSASKSEADK